MADFEKHLKELEQVVEQMERGELTLDESVRLFEEGVRLSNACKQELAAAEGKIQVLVDRSNGAVKTANLDINESVEASEDEE